jgi:hypothetical protein
VYICSKNSNQYTAFKSQDTGLTHTLKEKSDFWTKGLEMASIAAVAPTDVDVMPSTGNSVEGRISLPPPSSTGFSRRASADSLGLLFGNGKRNGSTGFLSGRKKSSSGAWEKYPNKANPGYGSEPLGLRDTYIPIKSCLSSKSLSTDACESLNAIKQPIRKNVSFHTIEFREHERTLSDHPAVSSGPAVGIGWSSVDSLRCTVAQYEEHRPPRRSKSHLIMPAHVREHILRDECQISQQDINQSLAQTTRIKVSRSQASRDAEVSRPPRLFQAFSKFRKGSAESNTVDKQVELLLEQSLRAERIRKEQRQSYLQALEKQLQADEAERKLLERVACETSNNATDDVPMARNDIVDVNLESLSLTASNPSSLSDNLSPFRGSPETSRREETDEPLEF